MRITFAVALLLGLAAANETLYRSPARALKPFNLRKVLGNDDSTAAPAGGATAPEDTVSAPFPYAADYEPKTREEAAQFFADYFNYQA